MKKIGKESIISYKLFLTKKPVTAVMIIRIGKSQIRNVDNVREQNEKIFGHKMYPQR